ncbi:hypothetical protein Z951_46095 [Streptomyces sp. PRh5]|nr:hypothetical protein Z951_46095 [Streptomyces sp. PRh5]
MPDPTGVTATRSQVAGAKRFNGGEGCYYANDTCWFTTKGDNRVWNYDAAARTIELAGPVFSPDGRRLYFSSQRGTSGSSSGGITYEVTGPFRG